MLGKLKRTLKEKCPECGKVLQLRILEIKGMRDGIETITPEEYIRCSNSNCDYEKEIEQKRRRRQDTF